MDLSNIIAKKKTYAKYMLKEITHICKDIREARPRPPRARSRPAFTWLTC